MTPARARHCNWGVLRQGERRSPSQPLGSVKHEPVTVPISRDGKAPEGEDPRVSRPAALVTPLRGSSGHICMPKPPSFATEVFLPPYLEVIWEK